jgi:photosystem II stability/assembly factor-like uncharacterized protein
MTDHIYAGVSRSSAGRLGGVFRCAVGDDHFEQLQTGLPENTDVHAITVHPQNPDIVFLGTKTGPYRSLDRGAHWERLGFPQDGGQVWSIEVHPHNPKLIYAGASPVAFYRSEDGGDTWRRLPDPGVPDRVDMPFACRVMRIAIEPSRPDEVFATIEANGAYRSLDRGESWEDCSATLIRYCEEARYKSRIASSTEVEGMLDGHALCVSAAAPGNVYLANRMGLFLSTDKGQSWTDMEIGRFSPLTYGRDIRVSPHDARVMYACLSPAAASKDGSVYRTQDLGKTWQRFDRGIKADATMMGVAVHPRDPDQVFAISRVGQVFGTRDAGQNWQETRLPEGCRDCYAIACG